MPRIIIIHGPMGSGKSTIVSELAKKLPNYILVDRAYIKDKMLKDVKKENRDIVKKLSADAMFLIARGLLKKGYSIILQEIRLPVVKKRLDNKYNMKSFYLHCTLKEAKERDLIRQNKYVRPEIIEQMHIRNAHQDEGDIEIDTEKNSITETVNKILKNLK